MAETDIADMDATLRFFLHPYRPIMPILLLAVSTVIHGQNGTKLEPLILGETHRFHSTQLNEERRLNVYVPNGYSNDPEALLPVIFLLDGSTNEDLIHTVGIVQFLTMIGEMPPTLVVGIANVDRKRDFTYPTRNDDDRKSMPTSGSSEQFIAFLQHEMVPYIDSAYRTSEQKTLIGQSLGGLLSTEILLKHPEIFATYIIVSPSLWWDDGSLLENGPNYVAGFKEDIFPRVIVMVGNEGEEMIGYAAALTDVLKATGNSGSNITLVQLPDEDHLTILHNALYNAFLMLNEP